MPQFCNRSCTQHQLPSCNPGRCFPSANLGRTPNWAHAHFNACGVSRPLLHQRGGNFTARTYQDYCMFFARVPTLRDTGRTCKLHTERPFCQQSTPSSVWALMMPPSTHIRAWVVLVLVGWESNPGGNIATDCATGSDVECYFSMVQ